MALRRPLSVQRCGIDLSWEVTSETVEDQVYIVTLNHPKYRRGHCTCDDYRIRVGSYVSRGEYPERWTCKHIDAVIYSIYDDYEGHRFYGSRRVNFKRANA